MGDWLARRGWIAGVGFFLPIVLSPIFHSFRCYRFGIFRARVIPWCGREDNDITHREEDETPLKGTKTEGTKVLSLPTVDLPVLKYTQSYFGGVQSWELPVRTSHMHSAGGSLKRMGQFT